MTRINVVPVTELTDKHLLAEYRELPRVYRLARGWYARGLPGGVPETYRLGKGHVKFFYDKLKWLTTRWEDLYRECRRRGMNVQHRPRQPFIDAPRDLWNDYTPTHEALRINRERIATRLDEAAQRRTASA